MLKKNLLFICLDSVRYDTFMAAKTPNMNKIGVTKKVHSFACFTQPSIIGYLIGYPPIGTGAASMFPIVDRWRFAPKQLSEKGYVTAWLSYNPVMLKFDREFDGCFRKYWNYFKTMEYEHEKSTKQIISDITKIVNKEKHKPIFICTLLIDTHAPYYNGHKLNPINRSTPRKNYEQQKRAVEYIDKCFPQFLNPFKKLNRPTIIIITADHGELFGPEKYGHDPRQTGCKFDSKLFAIPFIKGELKHG